MEESSDHSRTFNGFNKFNMECFIPYDDAALCQISCQLLLISLDFLGREGGAVAYLQILEEHSSWSS